MLTPETAEPILDIVSVALQRDELPFIPRSALRGHDVYEIDTALKLRIANEFLWLAHKGREAEIEARAEQWGAIPYHVAMQVVDDEKLIPFRRLEKDSREYLQLLVEVSPVTTADERINSLEMLSSFAKFCRHVGALDPLYWQRIYTRLDLPYGKGCPSGNDPVWVE
jgi:hypothetical protein